jgi:hypothetical protein
MRVLGLLLVAFAFVAVACGGDGDEPEPTPTIPTIEAPSEVPSSPTAAPTSTSAPATATSAPATATPAPTQTVPPTDGTVFPQNPGSTDPFPLKSNPDPAVGNYTLTDVRVGAHPESGGWDRIVFEFEDVGGFPGAHPGGIIEYVDEVFQCGSGFPVEVDGEAILSVRFDATQAHNEAGQLTVDALEVEGPGNSIIEAVSCCDFEGVVEWAVGTSGEENFKVALLENPSRVVIDIKWP